MKTGISTASFFLREECENAIDKIVALGAGCAEIFLGTYYEYRPEFAKAVNGRLNGTEVSAVHALSTNFEPQLFSASRRVRGDAFYWLDQIMRSAQLFGASKYSFHGGISHSGSNNLNEIAGYLQGVIEFCARYGVEVCLENVSWCTYNRPGLFGELKNRCPQLNGVLDLKQARRSGYPAAMYIEDMAGSISHVHLSDVDERGAICLPGKGQYNFTELFKRLQGVGFNGAAVIEVYGNNYGDYSEFADSLNYLNEIIYKLGC